MVAKTKIVCIVFLVCGLAAILCATLLSVIVPKEVQTQLRKNLVIKPDGSMRYQQWKSPTIPVTIEFYVFDILNAPQLKQGHVPTVKQKGPYVYREFLNKDNISFSENYAAATFLQNQWFIWDEENSCPGCNPFIDNITTVNMPYVIMAGVASSYSGLAKFVINLMLKENNEDLLMTKTVQELIWGYNDPLFEEFANLRKKWNLYFIPEISPFMNLQPNNTDNGEITINTGKDNVALVGAWEKWRGKNNVSLWPSQYANMLNGSDGTQFPPGVTKDKILYFFSPNLCRSIYVTYDSQTKIKEIDVLRFTTPADVFQNASVNPDNAAFCLHRCYPDGILAGAKNCEPSETESPILISTPHFLIGDPYLREQVQGLTPNREKHGLFLSIEPLTGVPLEALIRLQLNLHIRPYKGIVGAEGIKEAYVPVMYFSNIARVDDKTAKMMRDQILLPIKVCFYSEIALFSLGGVLILAAIVLFGCLLKRRSNLKSFIESTTVPPPTEKSRLITNVASAGPDI